MNNTKTLLKSVTDSDFRREVLDNPENFGMSLDREQLPEPIVPADLSFAMFVNDSSSLSALDVTACKSTCTQGPLTIVCDGTTK